MDESIEKEPYNFKIILLGNSNVGKTSIMKRYIDQNFEEKYFNTIGVDYEIKNIKILEEYVKLSVWDTAGQEKYRSINKRYYIGSDACFLVFDLTSKQSFDDLIESYNDFCQYGEKNAKEHIVVLGNKSYINKKEVNEEEINKFMDEKNLKYFETSAKTGKNINECFIYIMEKLIKYYKMNNKKKKDITESIFKESFMQKTEHTYLKEKNIMCC